MGGFTAYQDMLSNLDIERAIDPASHTATKTGEEITLSGGPVILAFLIGAVDAADADNYVTFTVEQATSSGGSFSAAASAQYRVGDSWDRLINATGEANAVKIVQFIPAAGYSYIKVIGTETGTTTIVYGVVVLQGGSVNPQTT